jgi:hypothetical protein
MVLIFSMLLLGMLGVAWRRIGASLRITSIRTVQISRDQGSIPALARALHLLETGAPPSSPYVCGVTINVANVPHVYAVTFAPEGETSDNRWSVQVVPGANATPMPDTFASSQSPP